jgi:hypothetical protein
LPQVTVVRLVTAALLSLVIGFTWYNVDNDQAGAQTRVGLFFLMIVNILFPATQSALYLCACFSCATVQ